MNSQYQHLPAERIARWAFLLLIALTVVVFGAFYLIGFSRPYADDPNFTAPLLTDVLLVFVFVLLLAAVAAMGWGMVRAWRRRDRQAADNGVPAKRIAWGVAACTGALLVVTFLLGSSTPIWVNGNEYTDVFWLKAANMFVWSSVILMIAAALAVGFYSFKIRNKNNV